MIKANQLSLLARAADRYLELAAAQAATQQLAIAASDARHEAQSGGGFSTTATLHMHMQFSEREHYGAVMAMTEDVYTSDSETKNADLMDGFKGYAETVIGEHDGITGAMIRCGMWDVDWHNLATFYLSERALQDA